MHPDDKRFWQVIIGMLLFWAGMFWLISAIAQTQPRQALIEVHDPDNGVYVIDGYADHIIYDSNGLYALIHTDADKIFHNGFELDQGSAVASSACDARQCLPIR